MDITPEDEARADAFIDEFVPALLAAMSAFVARHLSDPRPGVKFTRSSVGNAWERVLTIRWVETIRNEPNEKNPRAFDLTFTLTPDSSRLGGGWLGFSDEDSDELNIMAMDALKEQANVMSLELREQPYGVIVMESAALRFDVLAMNECLERMRTAIV